MSVGTKASGRLNPDEEIAAKPVKLQEQSNIDTAKLSDEEKSRHERDIVVQWQNLQALKSTRKKNRIF